MKPTNAMTPAELVKDLVSALVLEELKLSAWEATFIADMQAKVAGVGRSSLFTRGQISKMRQVVSKSNRQRQLALK